jgi:predicted nucleic acid-binding protein
MARENVAITGVTRAEILHGARNAHDLQRLMRALDSLPEIAISASTWDLLGEHLFRLRTRGIAVPFQDALIATSAIENSLPLWTRDSHFATIQTVLPALKLFAEPA